jgi:hypothetical protein
MCPSQATRLGEMFHSDLLRRAVSAVQTFDRARALTKDRPIDLASIERYLRAKLSECLVEARRTPAPAFTLIGIANCPGP